MEGLNELFTDIEAKSKFDGINKDISNLEEVYNNNLKVWYYRYSDKREQVTEEFEPVNFVSKDPDKLISCQTVKGIPLTESMFIEKELLLLSNVNRDALPLNELALFDAYINFLQNKSLPTQGVLENLHPDIFTNKIGYSVFERINKKFKPQKENHLANYSFLFYALQKDNFLLCTGTEFKIFLSDNFQIELDKIDSRQSGKSKKTIAYEAIKEQLTGIAQ